MEEELKKIKKLYGEAMSKFCRDMFSTLLEEEGKLLELLTTHFEPTHYLYNDIAGNRLKTSFKNYIYSLINKKTEDIIVNETPEELMDKAGYNLYECKTEEEIQTFKRFYATGEELCTFNGGRLRNCRVFFAVNKNVSEIKRERFKNPKRQDAYGTSVISIQFSRDLSHTLSIKNRYNHTVGNADATFSNNLDNIIPGLTKSFEKHYGIIQKNKNREFEIPNYVVASDGKYYKYNIEIENIYYCPNNIIIKNFEPIKYEKEKYIVFDYFVLSLTDKNIFCVDPYMPEGVMNFIKNINRLNIDKIDIKKCDKNKIISLIPYSGEEITIKLDQFNRMIELNDPLTTSAAEEFLGWSEWLKRLEMPNLEEAHNMFLLMNTCLEELIAPNLKSVGYGFLSSNCSLRKLSLPNLRSAGSEFLEDNEFLKEVSLPMLEWVLDSFLWSNVGLKSLYLPSLKSTGCDFLFKNALLKKADFPNLEEYDENFLYNNMLLMEFNAPKISEAKEGFLYNNINRQKFISKNSKQKVKVKSLMN